MLVLLFNQKGYLIVNDLVIQYHVIISVGKWITYCYLYMFNDMSRSISIQTYCVNRKEGRVINQYIFLGLFITEIRCLKECVFHGVR
jgi:hypothetical protein